ncbi:hypothetical protein HYDPIDRAFT_111167 [Hydnomerulius pinastri MD-312]|uniref:Glycoside hydrolase family 76 protein n=1 Tax=Hydnomerulius pinastri MD-312 TaxID=994086 RepID=A0A0C9WGD5_9AGAM|nr:hypothetical protein HYDPIDRAFT_111167 [Hydnomerulius pinastri MD-312]
MISRGLLCLALAVCAGSVLAQDLSVPSTWREPQNKLNIAERVIVSQTALNSLLPELNKTAAQFNVLGYWQGGNVFSAMANEDHVTRLRLNQGVVTTNLNKAFALYADYDQQMYDDDALWWATAAYYAYRAYGDKNLLSHAIKTWEHVKTFQLSPQDAASGSIATKSFPIMGSCEGKTMAGGVFWRPVANDTGVNSVTTGLFLTLSAYLAEATHNSTYQDSAIAAATWMKTLNMNSDGLALDTINANDCSRSPPTWLFTYNSGKLIEGLSVLADITGDQSWRDFLTNTVAAVTHTTAWQGANGVITEGADTDSDNDGAGFKTILIRAVHEAWARGSKDPQMRDLLRSYINVQYNALLELASTENKGVRWYSAAWAGPQPTNYTAWGQLAALDVLVSAVDINPLV